MTVQITDHRICLRHFQLTSSKLILFVTATSVQDLNDHNFVVNYYSRSINKNIFGYKIKTNFV